MSLASVPVEILHGRHNPHIDPVLHVWGWEIPVYLFLGGLAAGLIVLSAILARRPDAGELPARIRRMPLVALGLLSVGMGALLLDLEYPSHVLRFFASFQPASPMSWGSWILVLVYPSALALAWRLERRKPVGSGVAMLAVAAGVALGIYTGVLLGALGARPLWNSAVLGPLFLVSGLSTGAALMLLARPGPRAAARLTRWDTGLIVLELVLIGVFVIGLASGGRAAAHSLALILGGPYTPIFWALVVIAGLLVPLLVNGLEISHRVPVNAVAPILVLVGGLALRWVLVVAGQHSTVGLSALVGR